MSQSTSLNIEIKTKAELEGAKQAIASLERQIGAAKILGKEYKDLESQLARAKAAMSSSEVKEGFFGSIGSKTKSFVTGLVTIGAAAAAAKASIQSFAEKETAVSKLDAALAQGGQLTDDYRERLQKLADSLQGEYGIADDTWLNLFGRLTQFGATGSNIEQLTKATIDAAGAMGNDLPQATEAIVKAMQGSYEVFGRYGIKIEQTGDKTKDFAKLCEQLAAIGGGQLKASSETLTGQWTKMRLTIDDLLSGIGQWIAKSGLLQAALNQITIVCEYWGNVLGGTVGKAEGLRNSTVRVGTAMENSAQSAKKLAEQNEAVKTSADNAKKAIDAEISSLEKQAGFTDDLEEAQKGLELTTISNYEKTGSISAPVAESMRAAVEMKYAKAKQARKIQLSQDRSSAYQESINSMQRDLASIEESIATLTKQKSELEAYQAADSKAQALRREIVELEKKHDEVKKYSDASGNVYSDELNRMQKSLTLRKGQLQEATQAAEAIKPKSGYTMDQFNTWIPAAQNALAEKKKTYSGMTIDLQTKRATELQQINQYSRVNRIENMNSAMQAGGVIYDRMKGQGNNVMSNRELMAVSQALNSGNSNAIAVWNELVRIVLQQNSRINGIQQRDLRMINQQVQNARNK